ncbi:hypothetical protein BV22DRAFT_1129453 [Leucogyrophana mollusca]|uniref:Uncharacterized protein n=1 Tax=Leucogyrophana mollusca TaxID=85980 RepID=A0ACB8BJ58_9AGAM|nr:hypothetical protein BV22DRAFT_1129453 [Leucogyrophana mollusca]
MQPAPTTESGFIPRKEFIRDQRTTSSFCLLAISGSSLIRLYSFPLPLIASLRRLFDHFYLTGSFREDSAQNFCEFTLNGKPWASPKTVRTEKILIDILAVIYRHGYSFLSTIDYGREHDDRIAVSFSKPTSPSLPIPPHSPVPAASGSNLSHQTGPRNEKRVPFAISFVSATVLRVMSLPLHSTPAILQAVRGSWPRGVISEKTVGDSSYEFKLKGYKWFHEDTFATDSLRHILSLLSSLDAHACTLVASLSLSNRSRVKDLWIFTGPGSIDGGDNWPESPISQSGSNGDLRRSYRISNPEPSFNPDMSMPSSSLHRRVATAPVQQIPQPYPYGQVSPSPYHTRATSESRPPPIITNPSFSPPRGIPSTMLRKPAPRAQVPVSVDLDAQEEEDPDQFRTSLPSAVPSSAENMTGIGTLARGRFGSNLIYTATPGHLEEHVDEHVDEDAFRTSSPERADRVTSTRSRSPSPSRRVNALRPVSTRSKTPPLLSSHTPPRDPRTSSPPPAGSGSRTSQTPVLPFNTEHPPLLSPGMFGVRDSAFSSNSVATEGSCEVPIKWTGLGRLEGVENIEEVSEEQTDEQGQRTSPGPLLPGGWAMTPEDERSEPPPIGSRLSAEKARENMDIDDHHLYLEQSRSPRRSLHAVGARVDSPELITDQEVVRKSEAGLIGVMSPPRAFVPPPSPPAIRPSSRDSPGKSKGTASDVPASPIKASRNGSGNGWVLVNVEGKHAPEEQHGVQSHTLIGTPTSATHKDRGHKLKAGEKASMSPAAKAIVVIDAKEAKLAKGKGKSSNGSSGIRRLLSFSRPGKSADERKPDTQGSRPRSSDSQSNGQDKGSPHQGRFRNKLSRLGPPEASANPSGRQRINLD